MDGQRKEGMDGEKREEMELKRASAVCVHVCVRTLQSA